MVLWEHGNMGMESDGRITRGMAIFNNKTIKENGIGIQGINESFPNIKPAHVAKCGIAKPHENNNRMERLNGTLRERTKVVRAWKAHKTPLAEGQRIHYNFVRPHLALEGQTPAVCANIKMKGWKNLLDDSIKAITNRQP